MEKGHLCGNTHMVGASNNQPAIAQREKLLALLRQLRIDAGLTQTELASRLQRDQTFVSKYESGERRLDILEVREICRAIGVDFVAAMRRLDRKLK